MSGLHMTTAFRRTVERRKKRVWWPLSPTEMSAKRVPFRLIAPLDEKLTAYLAKKWTFATPRAFIASVAHLSEHNQLDLSVLHGDGTNTVARAC